jgi:hypothetical protein
VATATATLKRKDAPRGPRPRSLGPSAGSARDAGAEERVSKPKSLRSRFTKFTKQLAVATAKPRAQGPTSRQGPSAGSSGDAGTDTRDGRPKSKTAKEKPKSILTVASSPLLSLSQPLNLSHLDLLIALNRV